MPERMALNLEPEETDDFGNFEVQPMKRRNVRVLKAEQYLLAILPKQFIM
jgi:hypothetical protein